MIPSMDLLKAFSDYCINKSCMSDGIVDDAPKEAKEAYAKYLRLLGKEPQNKEISNEQPVNEH